MELNKVLKIFGLNERQANLYLTILQLGSASAYKISKKTKIPGATCYEILDSLKELGLVSVFRKKQIKYFTAEDPKKIVNRAKENIQVFEEALPEFNAMYRTLKFQPSVRFYEGEEGMKMILKEMLEEADEILSLSSADDLFEVLGDYWPKFLKERIRRKIPVKTILIDSPKARERKRMGDQEIRQVRLMPPRYSHHGFVAIWDKKVAIFSFRKEIMALVIESEEINRIHKSTFDFMWEGLDARL